MRLLCLFTASRQSGESFPVACSIYRCALHSPHRWPHHAHGRPSARSPIVSPCRARLPAKPILRARAHDGEWQSSSWVAAVGARCASPVLVTPDSRCRRQIRPAGRGAMACWAPCQRVRRSRWRRIASAPVWSARAHMWGLGTWQREAWEQKAAADQRPEPMTASCFPPSPRRPRACAVPGAGVAAARRDALSHPPARA